MPQRRVTVPNVLGMHARAAARFARAASGFASRVWVEREGVRMDGKSIMGLLLLAAPRGAMLTLTTEGPDAEAALEALATLVEEGFEETPAS